MPHTPTTTPPFPPPRPPHSHVHPPTPPQRPLNAGYAGEQKNSIIAIGLTIHNAPVELREKLAVPEAEWPRAIDELCAFPHIEEAAVLSTCNRMELYVVAVSWHRGVREVEEWLSRSSGVPLEELRPYLFLLRDRDATHHLLRVSGGLDSLVMGEGQILAQVKQVYKVGQGANGFGRQLTGLFKQAITAGKRVRSETSISTGSVSVSSAAVELAQLKLPGNSWDAARVCIIGAGKMSTLLVKHLLSKGCKRVTVLNRSLPRAEALAEEYPDMEFDIHLMPDLMQCVADSDVIFAASGAFWGPGRGGAGGWGVGGWLLLGACDLGRNQLRTQPLVSLLAHPATASTEPNRPPSP